ncbi:YggT family protein [Candidatus Marimicrobium litorale]|jgi:YggT family protein|uniref:YggT family protein n=1 Tax=Candidatus Marimicrobium litorale TaxID=2518991 RepID=A0ABT3T7C0_9GAMM|nr:YggT family protein [Candidatus Marimicrobium litorale]MCX2978157.1 YggT family protein [Candidatus Marimicrobium litorale]
MTALTDIFVYLVYVFFGLYLMVMLLRFLLQLTRADFYNPISQTLVKLTNPLVIPLRRIVPGYGGIDLASLLLALILQMLMIALLVALQTGALLPVLPLIMASLIGLAAYLVKIYFFAILAMIILSWIAQGGNNPALRLLFQLTEPVMAPFRKVLPPMGGLDLSPIFVFILINIIQIALGHLAGSLGVAGLVPWL